MQLDDLDVVNDLTVLSPTQQQIQKKTTSIAAASVAVGLNIRKVNSKILRYNTTCTNEMTTDREDLKDETTFADLGSINDEHAGPDADLKARRGKARANFATEEHLEFETIVNQH
ncbi:unnamed protein product [Schistosoma mattheei]|uniref:Uncharacterized protein n=1 Tax=Schistosoma mattheei TaxID=31246 RepID=A0A183NFW6_9TREM|nr:unnamed protein product [Schistosoma mattheei]